MITKKLAVYEYITPAYMQGTQLIFNEESWSCDFVRVSEWKEVEFKELNKDEIIPEIVKNIDSEIESIKEKAMEEVSKLQTKKAELLAICHSQQ